MRKRLAVVGIVLGLVGVTLGTVAFSSASAGTDITNARTIRVVAITTQFSQLDLPPTGFDQGDQLVFHDRLLRSGTVVGHDGGTCTATLVRRGRAPQFQCEVTAVLGSDQVAAQGLVAVANPSSFTAHFGVTGGTGIYSNARGRITVQQVSAKVANITFYLLP